MTAFRPDCIPTEAIVAPGGKLMVAVPSRLDLREAGTVFGGARLVLAYELVCALLAEARLHLAHTLPSNWDEHDDEAAAVAFLGGEAELERLRATDDIGQAKLP